MKAYTVQFTLPVENPVNNIRMIRKKQVLVFEVPINTPDIQSLGYDFLSTNAIANERNTPPIVELSTVSTDLKKKKH